jgi:hypothetical protein
MRALRRVLPAKPIFNSQPFYALSSLQALSLLESQYHLKGQLGLRRPMAVDRLLRESGAQIDQKMEEMERQRLALQRKGVRIASS